MAFKNESLINTVELGKAIKRRREELKLSLRDVARRDRGLGIDPFAYRERNGPSRCGQHRPPHAVARHAGRPPDEAQYRRDVEPVIYYPHEATTEIVSAHLRADKNLTPETAKALSELFRVAYKQFSKPTGKKK